MLMVRMTPTCVVTRIAVPRMDLGAIPLTLKFDGSTATYPAALQKVLFRFWFCKILQLKKDKLIVTPKDILCLQTHKEKLKRYTDSSITSFLVASFLSPSLAHTPPSFPPPCLPLFLPSFSRSLSPFFAPPILSFLPPLPSLPPPPSFLPSSLPSPFLCN